MIEKIKEEKENKLLPEKNRELNVLADRLEVLNKKRFQHVNYIISDLRRGDLNMARIDYDQQGDKFGDCPEIELVILTELFNKRELSDLQLNRLERLKEKLKK